MKFSFIFHLYIDIHTKVVNRFLRNFLSYLDGKNLEIWDLTLPTFEFTYNSSISMSIHKSPFEIVYGYILKMHINLTSTHTHVFYNLVYIFACDFHSLHDDIKNNLKYKMPSMMNTIIKIKLLRNMK